MLSFRYFARRTLGRWVAASGSIWLLLAAAILSSCTPPPGPALPPATIVKPEPTLQPTLTVPPASPSPTLPPRTVEQVQTPQRQETEPPEPVIDLTILHTNDVMGEVDPCG